MQYSFQLSYAVKVKLVQDGEIVNSHCECPSGQGPHGTCKHIAAVILAVLNFRCSGSLKKINVGCTDTLQSFHKPVRKYEGTYLIYK